MIRQLLSLPPLVTSMVRSPYYGEIDRNRKNVSLVDLNRGQLPIFQPVPEEYGQKLYRDFRLALSTLGRTFYPKFDRWLAYHPSTRPLRRLLRANGLLTNWVSASKTVRAEPVEAWAVFCYFNCRF